MVPLFEEMGFEVVAVLDGVEALEAFEQARARGEPFDIAVLDVRMPRRNGTDILPRLLEEDPGIRILLSSGFERQDLDRRWFQSGRVGFVGKPADEKQIISELRALEETIEGPSHG